MIFDRSSSPDSPSEPGPVPGSAPATGPAHYPSSGPHPSPDPAPHPTPNPAPHPTPKAGKSGLGASVPEGAWRKFHKVSPLAQGGALWVVFGVIVFNIIIQILETGMGDLLDSLQDITVTVVLIILGGLVALTLVVILFSWISWRYQSFAVVDSGVHKRSGILLKNHSHMRWDRIQTVEVEQKLFGRIFGFGSVKVESAGGEPATELGLLTMEDCGKLRREILTGLTNARAGRPIGLGVQVSDVVGAQSIEAIPPGAGTQIHDDGRLGYGQQPGFEQPGFEQSGYGDQPVYPGSQLGQHPGQHPGQPVYPESGQPYQGQPGAEIPIFDPDDLERDRQIFELPTSRLFASAVFNTGFIIAVFLVVVFIILALAIGEDGILFAIVGVGSGLIAWGKSLLDAYGTKVYLSPNGLRVRSGLTKLVTRSIPPQRLHAIEIRQPMLWRRKDWWRLRATLAGIGSVDDVADVINQGMIIPAGTRSEVLNVLWTMLPSAGTDDDATLIRDAFDGTGTGRFFLSAPKSARWLDPITWRSRGVCLTPNVAVFRTGRWSRRIVFVWQDHTQSLRMSQGPLQRKLGLGSIRLDLVITDSDASQKNMAIADVERMTWVENDLTEHARQVGVTESIEAWQRRVGV